jgi:hypothetical protein
MRARREERFLNANAVWHLASTCILIACALPSCTSLLHVSVICEQVRGVAAALRGRSHPQTPAPPNYAAACPAVSGATLGGGAAARALALHLRPGGRAAAAMLVDVTCHSYSLR